MGSCWCRFSSRQGTVELRQAAARDCQLHDFRLVRDDGGDIQLITAIACWKKATPTIKKVTFKYLISTERPMVRPGRPQYYFECDEDRVAKQTYCHVNQASKRN